jgi:hypothetical protein
MVIVDTDVLGRTRLVHGATSFERVGYVNHAVVHSVNADDDVRQWTTVRQRAGVGWRDSVVDCQVFSTTDTVTTGEVCAFDRVFVQLYFCGAGRAPAKKKQRGHGRNE